MDGRTSLKRARIVNRPETILRQIVRQMRASLSILAILAACAGASGCMTAAVGAAAQVGVFALQDRTIGEGIDDAAASQSVKARLLAADRAAFAEVDVEVAGRNLLLSGVAPTEEHRVAAETIARSVRTIDNVYNEVFVGPPSSFTRSAADEMITATIRARFTASPSVRAININIETFNGNVYLMGTARTEMELRRAAEIASTVRGVQRVISFMVVREPPRPYYAAAPAEPDYRAAPGEPLAGAPMDGGY